jgi:SAM-dependent methyltransferase
MPTAAPFPPLELANRVGSLEVADDPLSYYDHLGQRAREDILAVLPAGWSFQGKRALDFGCGAGRTLRHFLPEAESAEIWGCDIDADSIAWLDRELCPPLHVFRNEPLPPLAVESGHFDLVWALSVFTHLVESWSAWLLELHRVLKPGGILLATFMGEGMAEVIAGEEWREERVGMNVLKYGQGWDLGGPMVLHSPWWIREHWGRAFEVLHITERGFGTDTEVGQGVAVLRKLDRELTPHDLERIDPGEVREVEMLVHNLEQNRREIRELRHSNDHYRSEMARRDRDMAEIVNSRSWGLTKPLRGIGERLRARRGG